MILVCVTLWSINWKSGARSALVQLSLKIVHNLIINVTDSRSTSPIKRFRGKKHFTYRLFIHQAWTFQLRVNFYSKQNSQNSTVDAPSLIHVIQVSNSYIVSLLVHVMRVTWWRDDSGHRWRHAHRTGHARIPWGRSWGLFWRSTTEWGGRWWKGWITHGWRRKQFIPTNNKITKVQLVE